MVNKDRIQLWVDALRSGEFPQGRNLLEYTAKEDGEKSYCCLGVACRVAIANGLELNVVEHDGMTFFNGENSFLPVEVQDWYGLPDDSPDVDLGDEGPVNLVNLNDSETYNYDFPHIADAIEENFCADTA